MAVIDRAGDRALESGAAVGGAAQAIVLDPHRHARPDGYGGRPDANHGGCGVHAAPDRECADAAGPMPIVCR